jgi:NTP pyrophosphatase (non-canonical NTP hydrolase)
MNAQSQPESGLTLAGLQQMILQMYGEKDAARGDAATFLWLTEEFGELATALRSGTHEELAAEMADVLAWLATLANIRGVDLEIAIMQKYGRACPGCGRLPCSCDPAEKP